MKRKLSFLVALFLAAATSFAAPVKPGFKKTLPTVDGNMITAELQGDEFLSWWQASDGKRYTLSEDGNTFVEAQFEKMQKRARAMRAPLKGGIGGDHITYEGKKKGLIILVEFADKKFQAKHDKAYYEALVNQPGYTNDEGCIGSVHDYYLAQSNGKFDLSFDVVGPVCTSQGYAYYGKNVGNNQDVNVGAMLKEAANKAAPQVNLADYDWDGDGSADQVFFLYAGLGENASNDPNTICAHMHYMSDRGGKLSYSTGKIDRYACASELMGIMNSSGKYTGETQPIGIGTICHEFSHCLGFPDTYDTNGQQQYGMGHYDLLSNGNYLGEGFTPPNFTAWERIYAGWVEPIVLDKAATIKAMKSSTDYGRPFIMYNDNNKDEYYLFENRQLTGWDRGLYGDGLMVTHVDYLKERWTSNTVNTTGYDHQRMALVPADDNEVFSTSGIKGDLYPYVYKKNDGTFRILNNELTDSSSPAAMLWNSHNPKMGETKMGKPVTEITRNDDGTVSFLVMGGDDNNVLDNSTATGIATLKTTDSKAADRRVYSIDGRLLGTDINAMPKGLYIVGGRKVVK